ncbi:HEPN domain-containing protein [Armatimonas sp.]|uniref:HEPN domain-containing protein n=1 Tax=Armatimonas sp. TaxID=1872638 RepID=UPI0037524D29
MPSASLGIWQSRRKVSLDEIEAAHTSVGGTGRGRRFATQQINHAYVVLLSSQFQGFCRDLHSECGDFLVSAIGNATLEALFLDELRRGRKLDQGNPNPGNIGTDFGRFGITFWPEVLRASSHSLARKNYLETMNSWRNAIAHQDFSKVGGTGTVHLATIKQWRSSCNALAVTFDGVMKQHLLTATGRTPW